MTRTSTRWIHMHKDLKQSTLNGQRRCNTMWVHACGNPAGVSGGRGPEKKNPQHDNSVRDARGWFLVLQKPRTSVWNFHMVPNTVPGNHFVISKCTKTPLFEAGWTEMHSTTNWVESDIQWVYSAVLKQGCPWPPRARVGKVPSNTSVLQAVLFKIVIEILFSNTPLAKQNNLLGSRSQTSLLKGQRPRPHVPVVEKL